MPELNDHELLAEFARTESETAFATLVARHVNLVYSTALRFTGNSHHAEEITQAVFVILARKAGKLSPRIVLSGWLYQAARLTAANLVKGEIRRQRREQEAYMQTILNEPDATTWKQIAPLLDDAMGGLGETDRAAVVLRFFENKTAAEVAAELKLTEGAAHKRVNRALEKLRKFFTKRGVSSTTAIIAGTISANSVQAAPVALAKSVTAVAIAKGALKIMAWTKAKTAIVIGAGILLAAGTTTVIVKKAIPSTPAAIYEAIFENPTSLGMNLLESAPPTLIFRATQFPQKIGRGSPWTPTGKFVVVNFPLDTLFGMTYGFRQDYVVFPDDFNSGNFHLNPPALLERLPEFDFREPLKVDERTDNANI